MTNGISQEKFTIIAEVQNELATLIPNFLINRTTEIVQAYDLVNSGDFSALKKLAHAMKGACMSFGFHAAAKIAGAIESKAMSKDISSLVACLQRLQNSFENIEIHYV